MEGLTWLFDEAFSSSASDSFSLPPLSLRRNISLSKNPLSVLTERLIELKTEEAQAAEVMEQRIQKLRAEIEREQIKFKERKMKIEVECTAVERAIEKQRAAQAEKAAAMSSKSETSNSGEQEEAKCIVCLEKDKNSVFVPCGHLACCNDCASAVFKSRYTECVYCRTKISGVCKIFQI